MARHVSAALYNALLNHSFIAIGGANTCADTITGETVYTMVEQLFGALELYRCYAMGSSYF